MKIKKSLLALFFITCLLAACSSGAKTGNSKGCGCAAKKGMVGY